MVTERDHHPQSLPAATFAFAGLLDARGIVLGVNEDALKAAGLRREDVIGRPLVQTYWWSHAAAVQEKLRETLRRAALGETLCDEFAVRTADGRLITIDTVFGPLLDASGRVAQLVGAGVDVTERKQAQETLFTQRDLLQEIIDALPDYVSVNDAAGRYVLVNRAMRQAHFGGMPGVGGKPGDYLGPELAATIESEDSQVLQRGEPILNIPRSGTVAGAMRHRLVSKVPMRDASGNVVGILSTGRDVTDVVQAREALETSERRFRTLVENSSDGIALFDADGYFSYVSPASLRMAGYAAQDVLGKHFAEFIHPSDLPGAEAWRLALLENRRDPGAFRFRLRHKLASWLWIEIVGSNRLSDPAIGAIVTNFRDITERMRAEESLRESEARFRAMTDFSPMGIFLTSPEGSRLYSNAVNLRQMGLTADDAIGNGWQRAIHPDDRADVFSKFADAIKHGAVYQGINRYLRADGSVVWVDVSAAPIRDGRRIAGYVGTATDITERRRTELEIKETSRRLETLIADLPGFVYRCRNDERYTPEYVSEGALQVTGYTAQDFLSRRCDVAALVHPDDRERMWQVIQTAIAAKAPYELESRFTHASGAERWIWERGRAIFDATGELLALEGFTIDITDRKRAEAALSESEERLRLALEAAHMGTFDWVVSTNRIIWSKWHEELWGFRPGEFAGTYEYFASRVHPDDLPGISSEVARCMATRDRWSREFRVVWPDGSVHWIIGEGEFTFDSTGRAVRMRGVVREVTEQRRAEEELRAYARRLRELAGRLVETEETERRRINRELHDRIGQSLSALGLSLSTIRSRLKKDARRAVGALLDDAQKLVEDTNSQVRNIMSDLHPPALDDYGLLAALRAYREPYAKRTGVMLSITGEEISPRLPPGTETTLFRIAQEALINVAKHACVRKAVVKLSASDGRISLSVSDDGEGFDLEGQVERPTWGLATMRERAQAVGASLSIESTPGTGTRVTVEIQRAGT